MSVTIPNEPLPVLIPAPPSSPPDRAGDLPVLFQPSAELGEQLLQFQKAQAVIDHRKAEELARLRDIQNRD